tara:strand:+ start:998 stop:1459 length:462 start_codon:yes stop_codon:yes gene_type:complete
MKLLREYIRKLLVEQPQGYLYHGTTLKAAEEIEKKGFNSSLAGSKSGDALPGVSFTVDENIAQDHAEWAASKSGGAPALLVTDSSRFRLYPGDDFYELWDETGSSAAAIAQIKRSGDWDGVEMYSFELEEGYEELEVLIFDYNISVDVVELEE